MKGWLIGLLLLPAVVLADTRLQDAQQESEALQRDAAAAQQRIDQLDDAAREALQRYRDALLQSRQLRDYNTRMAAMVEAQRDELASLEEQLASIEQTQRAVLPLLQQMVSSLEQFVALDLPFLPEERAARINHLHTLMDRADVSVAEKYRRVIEAYQIESDYGRTLEAWRGTLKVEQGQRTVEFLRLGRVMLYFQSLDSREQGYWDASAQRWTSLPGSYRRALEQGIRIARQQQTPEMLRLPLKPVTPTVAGEGN
ncbi:DUF3450 domain-containing protein [Halopseudomonas salegens]|uniref:DUF3450 domain-containing protein n=1 Tax=Halopseudomonas salegens TaxID=1434072 RepID=A0A1H2EGY4_9GAMM|nr:DUF3450 domain-containing protein [Halopseudomonas salegens]SDT94269.1 Protein of unknown function [Halopseudomonas salegens]